MKKFNKLYKEILENNIAGGIGSVFNSGQIQAGQYGNQFPSQNDQAYAPGDARLPYSIFGRKIKKKKKSKKIKIQRRNLVEAVEDDNYNYGFPPQWTAVKTKEGFNLLSHNTKIYGWKFIAKPYKEGWVISNGGNGITEYFKDKGRTLHREDGPAITRPDGKHNEYWINGKQISYEEFLAIQKVNKPEDRGAMIDLLGI
jgi:hypothetical protein